MINSGTACFDTASIPNAFKAMQAPFLSGYSASIAEKTPLTGYTCAAAADGTMISAAVTNEAIARSRQCRTLSWFEAVHIGVHPRTQRRDDNGKVASREGSGIKTRHLGT